MLRRHVAAIGNAPRNLSHFESLQCAAAYIDGEFTRAGYDPRHPSSFLSESAAAGARRVARVLLFEHESLSTEEDTMARGFASLNHNRRREISSKGGKLAHAKGTAHEWSPDEAREAGRKGAVARRKKTTSA